jgi:hypothetical protein
MAIADEARLSTMDAVHLDPVQLVFVCMNRLDSVKLVRDYVRVCAPERSDKPVRVSGGQAGRGGARGRRAGDSRARQILCDAFVMFVERLVDMPKRYADEEDNWTDPAGPELRVRAHRSRG